MMTRNQMKVAATNPKSTTSNIPPVINNNPTVVYPSMFDRWSLPL
jgi:hypothetical protein